MVDHVLSVWPAGTGPPDGGAPIRLCAVGVGAPVADHGTGFDVSPLRHGDTEIDLGACLSAAGMLDTAAVDAIGDQLWSRLTPGAIGAALPALIKTERIYLDLRAEELLRYPWELLRLGHGCVFAANQTRICLGRPEPCCAAKRGMSVPRRCRLTISVCHRGDGPRSVRPGS